MDDLPRIIGFRLAADPPDEPIWMPRTAHAWDGEPKRHGDGPGHRYDMRCAICRFADFPEARDAVLAAAAAAPTVVVADNVIRHQEGLPWAKDLTAFMSALHMAMRETRFIMAARGLTAEQIHTIWDHIANAMERLAGEDRRTG